MHILLNGPYAAISRSTAAEYQALREWLGRLEAMSEKVLCEEGHPSLGASAHVGVPAYLRGPRFFAGLVPYVQQAWGVENVTAQEQGVIPPVDETAYEDPLVQGLWPHQAEAVDALLANHRGVVDVATGSGKTRAAAALMRLVTGRWLYTVPRVTLAAQSAHVFQKAGLDVVLYDGGRTWLPTSRIVVATTQSLLCALQRDSKVLAEFTGVCADEVHGAGADGFAEVLLATTGASLRCGFSATAVLREDGRNVLVAGLLGPVVYRKTARDLVNAGVLSPGLVRFLPYNFPAVQARRRGVYQEVYSDLIVCNANRNALLVREALKAEAPRLVIVRDLEHGVILQEMFRARTGHEPPFVQGSDPVEAREVVFDAVRTGQVETLIVSSVGEAGVDLPSVATVVNAAAGKSAIASIQRLGRGTRRPAGKFGFELLDVKDDGHVWFSDHAAARAAAYDSTGYVVDTEMLPRANPAPDVVLLEAGPAKPRDLAAAVPAKPVDPLSWAATDQWDKDIPGWKWWRSEALAAGFVIFILFGTAICAALAQAYE